MLNVLNGKTHAYLYGLQKVATFRPKEATHLLQKVFEKGDLNTRLATFRAAILSPHIGDGKLVGDLFVKLMAATTKEEREEIVEPFFQSLLQKSNSPISKASQGKLAWLNALCHGWQQESLS
ncbi:MAG: hypothetical protein A2W61_04340 [Deltaproteobacteria bacterium RIFCSPLOWO2_01_44_7]|nr:MAG: hypothetical protein A2712_01920 [Deltaproteobacteria bacterium RIFCSPHIGHO2_01_FULL_43_49]OGQ15116.1 MAG: hypothetical protein A3D22_03555 [Deltaproteobacteria bacterium RIFCSPHIGHO2_02_FULL_44_53]OGQ27263.1 MAG: hypothetical protein A3D98_02515 [Deltaproteobacteria bacterium RIFCSPHIGHO2_12_FULL_44_21]OGQ31633.1 MAG: hypothetical protein A2979_04715 [Deltaproteobacteria bacterium RIFCSPLOWO2_01_FULL_45_74]OGQ42833.1 MAG: hypothetical protein A3I70_07020 [Deltaproteobacteria bacterium 